MQTEGKTEKIPSNLWLLSCTRDLQPFKLPPGESLWLLPPQKEPNHQVTGERHDWTFDLESPIFLPQIKMLFYFIEDLQGIKKPMNLDIEKTRINLNWWRWQSCPNITDFL